MRKEKKEILNQENQASNLTSIINVANTEASEENLIDVDDTIEPDVVTTDNSFVASINAVETGPVEEERPAKFGDGQISTGR